MKIIAACRSGRTATHKQPTDRYFRKCRQLCHVDQPFCISGWWIDDVSRTKTHTPNHRKLTPSLLTASPIVHYKTYRKQDNISPHPTDCTTAIDVWRYTWSTLTVVYQGIIISFTFPGACVCACEWISPPPGMVFAPFFKNQRTVLHPHSLLQSPRLISIFCIISWYTQNNNYKKYIPTKYWLLLCYRLSTNGWLSFLRRHRSKSNAWNIRLWKEANCLYWWWWTVKKSQMPELCWFFFFYYKTAAIRRSQFRFFFMFVDFWY